VTGTGAAGYTDFQLQTAACPLFKNTSSVPAFTAAAVSSCIQLLQLIPSHRFTINRAENLSHSLLAEAA